MSYCNSECLLQWRTVTKPYTGIWFTITGKEGPPWTCVIHKDINSEVSKRKATFSTDWHTKPRNRRGSYTHSEVTAMTQNLSTLRCGLTNNAKVKVRGMNGDICLSFGESYGCQLTLWFNNRLKEKQALIWQE